MMKWIPNFFALFLSVTQLRLYLDTILGYFPEVNDNCMQTYRWQNELRIERSIIHSGI